MAPTPWSTGTSRSRSGRGSRAQGPRSAATRPQRSSPSCAPTPTRSTGLVRDFTGLVADGRHGAAARGRPARLDPGQRRRLRSLLAPVFDKLTEKKGAAHGPQPGHRLPGHRRRGRWPARLPGRQGARPVRPVPRPPGLGPAAAGRPQHRPRRAGARRRPHRLPALGLPARGDPPGAVHRGAVDARPPVRPDRAPRGHHRAEPAPRRRAASGSPRRSRAAAPAAA